MLIVVHEFGHYLRRAPVRREGAALFGRLRQPLWVRSLGRDGTEWAVAAVPLGGYVKMLDEREGAVAPRGTGARVQPAERRAAHRDRAAGPVANFLLAIALYWALVHARRAGSRPVLGAPPAATPAHAAGFAAGETVPRIDDEPVATWQDLRWRLLAACSCRNRR